LQTTNREHLRTDGKCRPETAENWFSAPPEAVPQLRDAPFDFALGWVIAALIDEPLFYASDHLSLRLGKTLLMEAGAELEPELFPIPLRRSPANVLGCFPLRGASEVVEQRLLVDLDCSVVEP
jgi:hypothetical protein